MAAIIGRGQSKPVKKFIYQMMLGLNMSKSIRLSNIARALSEDTALLYTEKRLHRNLYGKKLDMEKLRGNYLKFVGKKINNKKFIIALDLQDIRKEYAKSMECLARIRDGSKGEICNGYINIQIEAISRSAKTRRNFPLALTLYSHKEEPYVSENQRVVREVEYVSKFFPQYTWVFDRGFDRKNIITELENLPVTYVIRQVGIRNLVFQGEVCKTRDLAKRMNIVYDVRLPYMSKRTRKVIYFPAKFGIEKVRFENSSEDKTLIVLMQFNNPPLMLITNKIPKTQLDIAKIIQAYIQRWGCEESTRFLKSKENGFDIEDIRVLKYEGIKRMMHLVTFAYGFLCLLHHEKREQVEAAIAENTKSFKPLPRFYFYRTIESTQRILERERVTRS